MSVRQELVYAIADGLERVVAKLRSTHPDEHFYYMSLTSIGGDGFPAFSAWSTEALRAAAATDDELLEMMRWSYADSPYVFFEERQLEAARRLWELRTLPPDDEPDAQDEEFEERLAIIVDAMAEADRRGVFGTGAARLEIVIIGADAEQGPSFIEDAKRLNPPIALERWLRDHG